ncbi:hypothetical protein [Aureliella helgolandensis]|nr:hypothetical protein [Aureliella helgolandensis]
MSLRITESQISIDGKSRLPTSAGQGTNAAHSDAPLEQTASA